MNVESDVIREYVVYGLDVLRRRWFLLCLPVALAAVLGAVAVQFAATKYVTKSVILLQGANRTASGFGPGGPPRGSPIEQVRAIEAWVKSDEVMAEILPRLSDDVAGMSPAQRFIFARAVSNALNFQLVSNGALEVTLEGTNPVGLSRKLEIILSRIMAGLTGPDQSILSAPEFVLISRREEAEAAEEALGKAIEAAGLENPPQVKAALAALWAATRAPRPEDTAESTARLRAAISSNPATVRELLELYATHEAAAQAYAALQGQAGQGRSNYVGIFDSPDNLLIIGRPKDPVVGESAARKLAILSLLLSIVGSGGLIVLLEFFSGLPKTRADYERASGLPVVARIAKSRARRAALLRMGIGKERPY